MTIEYLSRTPARTLLFQLLAIFSATSLASAQTQSPRSTWHCLTEDTVVAARMPNGEAVVQAFVENTKLGAVLFNDKRIDAAKAFLVESENDEGESLDDMLSRYGLVTEDVLELVAHESGMALLLDQQADPEPMAVVLVWFEPGAEVVDRVYDFIGKAAEDWEDDQHPLDRIDFELAGHTVMQLTIPEITIEHDEDFELPEDYEDLSEDEAERAWEKANQRWEDSAVERVGYRPFDVCAFGDKILMAGTTDSVEERELESTAERLADMFGRLLDAHVGNGGGFVRQLTTHRAMADVSDLRGEIVFELLGDVAPVVRLARTAAETEEGGEEGIKILELTGAEKLGPFAVRVALDRSQLHTRAAWMLRQPLTGLLQVLEQPPLDARFSAWVPASVVRYSLYSFDLGDVYAIIQDEVLKHYSEEAGSYFQLAEGQVANMAGAGLEEVLRSLGNQHHVLTFEPRMSTAAPRVDEETDEPTLNQPTDRVAFVWQIAEGEIWPRLMQQIGNFSVLVPGLKSAEEQGFRGWRYQQEALEGGLLFGKGYLVLAYGPGVLEATLSALNNPPRGRAALFESDLYDRASELLEHRPALAYELVDGNRYTKSVYQAVTNMLSQVETLMDVMEDGDADAYWIQITRRLMPDEDEIDGLFGPAVSQWGIDEHGLWGSSVSELPPAP